MHAERGREGGEGLLAPPPAGEPGGEARLRPPLRLRMVGDPEDVLLLRQGAQRCHDLRHKREPAATAEDRREARPNQQASP